jgi:formylglycine-generating enzyme required for sulfatase activity
MKRPAFLVGMALVLLNQKALFGQAGNPDPGPGPTAETNRNSWQDFVDRWLRKGPPANKTRGPLRYWNGRTEGPPRSTPSPAPNPAKPAGDALAVVVLPGGAKLELAWIPRGTFWMGCSPEDNLCEQDERDLRGVAVPGFWMGRYEVTQRQWTEVMGSNPSTYPGCGGDCPVETVSWNDVQGFLSKAGNGLRLPTEVEWEYAARAGTTTALYTGPLEILGQNNGPALDPIAWYSGNSSASYDGAMDCSDWPEKQVASKRCGPHQVGQKRPNAFGLHDMLGNVWEWCQDAGAVEGEDRSPRMVRGGSWGDDARSVRASGRVRYMPTDRAPVLGFRVVRSVAGEP